jgi:glycosyltransferase involved in cell wall biosynthesis
VLEAMACSNAVIASRTGDTELFINSDNGLLIDLSVFQLTQAIESFIADPAHAHKLGVKGREDALNNHTIEKYTAYFTGVINNAWKKHFSAPS